MFTHLSIVLIEDNDDLRELTADALRDEGHRVIALSCAEELQDKAKGISTDLFLIDLNLPGEDGFSLARRIRAVHPLAGIIIVSARSELQDKIDGYDCGADAYLAKPVAFEELRAAINSFARRQLAQLTTYASSEGALRLKQCDLHGPNDQVRLTSAESALLTAFARAPSGRLENWQLLELLGDSHAEVSKTSIEVRITRLRKKLIHAGACFNCLESIRGVGYRLHVPIQILD